MTGSAHDPMGRRAHEVPPGVPRWVRLLALGLVVALVAVVVVMLLVGGEHGPGRHGG
ncbi:hypothetical protein [Nocardioides gansuensis]|uniref:hypothetical protein n=1 Tax=Nocardioides gansuensis TaxID=2138300 RepID=UPI001402C670|nr:hypothetical protein [Nocardioides gansuensis]